MASPVGTLVARGEEILARAGESLPRVADELPALAWLLRAEPRLRAVLADITVDPEAKAALLQGLLADRVDLVTLEVAGLLADTPLTARELEKAMIEIAIRGILAASHAEGSLEEVEDELFRFARVIDSDQGLRGTLTDPALPTEAKVAVLRDLLQGRANPRTVALASFEVEMGADRDPSRALIRITNLAAERRGRIVVEARAAVPLDVQRQAHLSEALSRAIGRPVAVEFVLDPDVIGGVVARAGDEVIDGSVKRKLELALEELTA